METYFGGRRRVYWEQEAGYSPPFSISQRRKGVPRTEAERRFRHEELFPGTPLPERGTRRSLNSQIQEGVPAPVVTAGRALLTGLGIAAGFAIFRKLTTR